MDTMSPPPGAIPVDQFEALGQQAPPAGAIPVDQFESQEEHFGTIGEQIKAGLEGVAQGLAGPLAPLAETKLLGVRPEKIRAREEVNPFISGLAKVVGFGVGAFTGTGEAALLGKAGEAAVGAAKLAEPVSFGAKVGSEAVKQATEFSLMQGGDEVSKMILNDPEAGAQNAIAHMGLAAALGGTLGAGIGLVSPIWAATVGPKVADSLEYLKNRINGPAIIPKEEIANAVSNLGLELDPIQRVALSSDAEKLGTLVERDHPEVLASMDELKNKISDNVVSSMGVKPEEILTYDKADMGESARDAFEKEFREKLAPIEKKLNEQAAEDAHIVLSDDSRLNQFGKLVERGQDKFSATSDYAKEYQKYGQQLLDHENVGGVVKLENEINGRLRGLNRNGDDMNTLEALRDIKAALREYREKEITNAITETAGEEGSVLANAMAKDKIAENLATRKQYGEVARVIDEAQDHFGLGNFEGKEGLARRIAQLSPEQAASKLSFKNNRDAIPFLQKYFPETFEKIRQNEVKELLKPAIKKGDKAGTAIDVKALDDTIRNAKAGQNTYLRNVISPEALARAEHAKTILDAIPSFKSSKSASWIEKLFKNLPAGGLAAVSFLTGHNPIGGAMIGGIAGHLGTSAPDSIKLGLLKWLASDQPIKSAGFKSMVDYIENVTNGQNTILKATNQLFKQGTRVLSEHAMPSVQEKNRLDKLVTKLDKGELDLPHNLTESHLGHYLPEHQVSATKSGIAALQYLSSLKPKPHTFGPLDKPVPPQPSEVARYNKALEIAQQPAVVLQKIKDGTLQSTDIADLHAMYPALYAQMTNNITNQLAEVQSKGISIPYRTRISMSLFLGQPLDNSMSPQSIIAAQPQPTPIPGNQGGAQGKTRKGTTTLGKSNNSYQTADQQAEFDRGSRH